MTAPLLHRRDSAWMDEGPCIPRVLLECSRCYAQVATCHVDRATLRAYLDGMWRCASCARRERIARWLWGAVLVGVVLLAACADGLMGGPGR